MTDAEKRSSTFIAILTIALIGCALYIFSPFLRYILVAASLAMATSHAFVALLKRIEQSRLPDWLIRRRRCLVSALFTAIFLLLIFIPLLYFISVTIGQVTAMNIGEMKQNILAGWFKLTKLLADIPYTETVIDKMKNEGTALISGNSIETILHAGQNMISSVGRLIVQIAWILIFYFLFNLYGNRILHFLATLMPTSSKHERYLYGECTGTVAVVFYGSLFNMLAQGIAFGILMFFIGGYDTLYLGVLAGFCSIVPLVGSALVFVPVALIEILHGHWGHAIIIILYAWAVMGFAIDNILRMLFISLLKKTFHFQYTMNEILILLSILAGIATLGFWGLVLGPTVTALAIAAANLYRDYLGEEGHIPTTGC